MRLLQHSKVAAWRRIFFPFHPCVTVVALTGLCRKILSDAVTAITSLRLPQPPESDGADLVRLHRAPLKKSPAGSAGLKVDRVARIFYIQHRVGIEASPFFTL